MKTNKIHWVSPLNVQTSFSRSLQLEEKEKDRQIDKTVVPPHKVRNKRPNHEAGRDSRKKGSCKIYHQVHQHLYVLLMNLTISQIIDPISIYCC